MLKSFFWAKNVFFFMNFTFDKLDVITEIKILVKYMAVLCFTNLGCLRQASFYKALVGKVNASIVNAVVVFTEDKQALKMP